MTLLRARYWLARQLRRLERRLDPLPRPTVDPIRNAAGHVIVEYPDRRPAPNPNPGRRQHL